MNRIITILVVLSFLASCQHRELTELPDVSGTPLQLNVTTAPVTDSRALISSACLPSGSQIGFSLTDESGSTYMGIAYNNVKATAVGSTVNQKYILGTSVLLDNIDGTIQAYYPWEEDVDVKSIPIKSGDTDYMYSQPVTGVTSVNPQANLVMQHALAAVRVNLKRGMYAGTGLVKSISVAGNNIAGTGRLDATTGELSGLADIGKPVPMVMSSTLNNTITKDFILIPTNSEAPLTIVVNIDGVDYSVSTDAICLQQGILYSLDITVDYAALSWSDLTVETWGYDGFGNPVVPVGNYTVTLTGNMEGIAFNNTVNEDGTVTIVAVPMESGKKVVQVTANTGAVMQQTVDDMTGIRTVILSDITADTQVNFNGISL